MGLAADIVVYDDNGDVLLLAEVKALESTSASWAMKVRGDIARRRRGVLPRYFAVVARDQSYLWTDAAVGSSPAYVIATENLLGDYFRDVELDAREIAPSAFELLVGIWLRDLTDGEERARRPLPPGTGLAEAAEHGRIEFPNAA